MQEKLFSIVKDYNHEKELSTNYILYYVIKGKVCLETVTEKTELYSGEILLMNSGTFYSFSSSNTDIILKIVFPNKAVNSLSENYKLYCNSHEDSKGNYKILKRLLDRIVYLYTNNIKNEELYNGIISQLLGIIIENNSILENKDERKNISDDERIIFAIKFIYDNFTDTIRLSDISEKLFISDSTLSKLFFKKTGRYFSDFLNAIRLEKAAKDLRLTDDTVTKILVNSGFTNPSVFNKLFKEKYGVKPTTYRNDFKYNEPELIDKEIINELKLLNFYDNSDFNNNQLIEIGIISPNKKPINKNWCKTINIGSLKILSQASIQKHILYLHKYLGYTHIRVWNIFSNDLMISDGKDNTQFNYFQVDEILDFVVNNNLKMYLDFANRPNTALNSGGNSIFFNVDTTIFESKSVWEKAVEDFIKHLIDRYDTKIVSEWYFELSKDMSGSMLTKIYNGDNEDYYDNYKSFYRIIKYYIPKAKVG